MNIDPSVIASGTGASGALTLPPGAEYRLSFSSAGAFALDVQDLAGDQATYRDVYRGDTKVTIDSTSTTTPLTVIVPGGTYRMNVSTYNNPITMWGIRI